MEEEWRKVPSLDHVWVSDQGRVWVEEFVSVTSNGRLIRTKAKYRKVNHKGRYLTFTYKDYPRYVHRCIAEAFVKGQSNERNMVNHKDGVKLNNTPCNLEWVTSSSNNKHAYDTGLRSPNDMPKGEECTSSKLTQADVDRIKRNAALPKKERMTQRELGAIIGVSPSTISAALRGQNWKVRS